MLKWDKSLMIKCVSILLKLIQMYSTGYQLRGFLIFGSLENHVLFSGIWLCNKPLNIFKCDIVLLL